MRKITEKLPHNVSRLFIKWILGIQILTKEMWQLNQTDLKANIKMDFFQAYQYHFDFSEFKQFMQSSFCFDMRHSFDQIQLGSLM